MQTRNSLILATFAFLAALIAGPNAAEAQLSNRPFAFGNPGGGVGISIGGRQAVLEKRFTGRTPSVLVRDRAGELVEVSRAPGSRAAIARRPGSSTIPGFRRADWRLGQTGLSVGAFNGFFVPRSADSGYVPVQADSGDVINTWTTRVVTGDGRVIYRHDSAVDLWTAQVGGL